MDFIAGTKNYAAEVRTLRRWLHQHPEPGFSEHKTAEFIAEFLTANDIPFRRTGETGLIAELQTGRTGSTVALRADIDALPIVEENEVSYKSQHQGFMHACGHDSHTAILMAAAKFIKDNLDQYNGKIRFLFQPAEESPPGGAISMIADNALDGVDFVYGLHCLVVLPPSVIGLRD